MTRLLRAAVVTALALSLVAAGCGSDKKANNYVDAVNKAQTDFAASINNLQKTGTGTGIQGAKDTFNALKAAIDNVVSDLKAATPPDKVKDLHNQLIDELNTLDKAVTDAGAALGTNDPQKILKAQ